MPRTVLNEGAEPSPHDREVLRAFLRVAAVRPGVTRHFYAAVKNQRGEIYRLITLHGIGEKANFEEEMRRIGFEDERAFGPASAQGFDSIYRRVR